MSDIAIKVENLGKMYRIGGREEGYITFRESLTKLVTAPFRRLRRIGKETPPEETIWALSEIGDRP